MTNTKENKEKEEKKIYKVRLNCVSFVDVVVEANNEEEAISEAHRINGCLCSHGGMEFGEFIEVGNDDEKEN